MRGSGGPSILTPKLPITTLGVLDIDLQVGDEGVGDLARRFNCCRVLDVGVGDSAGSSFLRVMPLVRGMCLSGQHTNDNSGSSAPSFSTPGSPESQRGSRACDLSNCAAARRLCRCHLAFELIVSSNPGTSQLCFISEHESGDRGTLVRALCLGFWGRGFLGCFRVSADFFLGKYKIRTYTIIA